MAAEVFDRSASTGIIIFEIIIIVAAILTFIFLSKIQKKMGLRFLIAASGIFIFEMFTAPMWHNLHLGVWAYLYRDVSWILTLGWTTCIILTVTLIDHFLDEFSPPKRFLLSLAGLTVLGVIGETLVINLGIRTYSPEVEKTILGYIPLLHIPVNALYYIPVFMALVVGFYQYWCLVLDNKPIMPMKKRKWGRDFVIALVAVLLFEIMVEPMVNNANLPKWTYLYKDVNLLLTGIWIFIVWLALKLTDKFFIHIELGIRFLIYLVAVGIFALPFEAYFIAAKIRIYGPSATKNLSGITLPGLNVPVEVIFAIPLYFALIIAFIRYWEIILDNRRLK